MQRRTSQHWKNLIHGIRRKLFFKTNDRKHLTLRWEAPILANDEPIREISIYWTSTDTLLSHILHAQFPVVKTITISPKDSLIQLDHSSFQKGNLPCQALYSSLFITGNNNSFTLCQTNSVPPEQSGYIQLDYYYVDRNCEIRNTNICSLADTTILCVYNLQFRKGWNQLFRTIKSNTEQLRVVEYSTTPPQSLPPLEWTAIPY